MRKDKQNRNLCQTTNNQQEQEQQEPEQQEQEYDVFTSRIPFILPSTTCPPHCWKKKRKKEKQSHQKKVYFQKKILFIFSIVKSVTLKKKDIKHRTSKKYSDECHTTHLNATSLTVLPTCLISTELSHYNACLI